MIGRLAAATEANISDVVLHVLKIVFVSTCTEHA